LRALDAAGTAASVTVVGSGELRTGSLNTQRDDRARQEKN
jgi:hypothetical protein